MTATTKHVSAAEKIRRDMQSRFGDSAKIYNRVQLKERVPTTAADLEKMLADPAQMKDIFASKDRFEGFIKDYASEVLNHDTTIATQVRDEVSTQVAEFLKDSRKEGFVPVDLAHKSGIKTQRLSTNKIYNKNAPGAALDDKFEEGTEGIAQFLQAIWHQAPSLSNASDLIETQNAIRKVQNSYGSTVPADGGFLIPETLRSEMLQLALETAVVRPRATVIPMSSLAVPIPTVDDTSHATSVFGGIVAYWTEEGANATESNAKFGRVRLEAKKLVIYCQAPNELVADAPAFGAFLGRSLPAACAFYEDDKFISGTGIGEPLGVLNGNGAIVVPRATTLRVKFADIVNMFVRLLPGSYPSAVWQCSPGVIADLMQLFMAPGGTTDAIAPPLWLTGGQMIEGAPTQILGRPLIISEKVPDIGSAGDLSLVDYNHYLIGDRQAMQATSSPHYKFQSDETAYKIVERVDGRPWLNTAITPKNGGATLSPYVKLKAETS